MTAAALLLLACGTDPCAWSHGSWRQTGASHKGKELPPPEFEASLAVSEVGFGYRPERGATRSRPYSRR